MNTPIFMNIFKKQNGMNIVGQGGKIILFMLPSLIAAILVHTVFPPDRGTAREPSVLLSPWVIYSCFLG